MFKQSLRQILFISALLCPLLSSAASYVENFQDGVANNWEPQQPEQWEIYGSKNLSYRAQDIDNDSVMISTYAGAEYQDVDYRVSIKKDNGYAVYAIFRASADFYLKDGINKGSGYAFGISNDCGSGLPPSYSIYKLTDGVYQNIQSWTTAKQLKCDVQGNRVGINAKGRLLKFYINNKLVFRYRDKNPLGAGRVGLMGYTAQPFATTHDFDNIYIRDLAN